MNKKYYGLYCGVAIALSTTSANADEGWKFLGPDPIGSGTTGRIAAVAPSPEDADVVYIAAASGGIWRLNGDKWTALTEHQPTSVFGAVAVAPSDAKRVYAGSGEANYAHHSFYGIGFFRSKDGGDTWEHLAKKTFSGRTFSKIVVSSKDPNVVFASVMHAGGFPAKVAAKGHPQTNDPVGLYRSKDGGDTWEALTKGLPKDVAASDVSINPKNPDIVYVALGDPFGHPDNGIFRSTDGGDSWKKLEGGLPKNHGRVTLAIGTSDPDRLYALTTAPSNASGGGASTQGAYRSDDGGDSWKKTNPGGVQSSYGWFLSAAAVHPEKPDVAIFGGVTAARTKNGGDSYTDATPPHVDIHAFVWDKSGRLLVGDDGGLHRSTNDGGSWKSLGKGLTITQLYGGLALHSEKRGAIAGGFQDNGVNVRSDGNSNTWRGKIGGDGGPCASHPESPNIIMGQSQRMAISRSTNGGGSFRSVSGLSGSNAFFSPIVFAPSNKSRVYLGTQGVLVSNDGGARFSSAGKNIASGSFAVRALAVAPSDEKVVYASTNEGKVFVSEDGAKSFTQSLEGVDGFMRTTRELAVSPLDPKQAYLAVGQFGRPQVLRTDDGGKSWKPANKTLPDIPVNTVAVAKAETESKTVVVAGSDRHVYLSCNEGGHWRRLGKNLPTVVVTDVMIDSKFNRVVVGTMGRGVWEIDLPDLSGEICDPPKEGENGESGGEGSGSSGSSGGSGDSDGSNGSKDPGKSPEPDKSGDGTQDPSGGESEGSGNSAKETGDGDGEGSPGTESSGKAQPSGNGGGKSGGGCNSSGVGLVQLFGIFAALGWTRRKNKFLPMG